MYIVCFSSKRCSVCCYATAKVNIFCGICLLWAEKIPSDLHFSTFSSPSPCKYLLFSQLSQTFALSSRHNFLKPNQTAMKALFPVFCRPLGYLVMAIALMLPLLMALLGKVTDANLLFYKECSKLLMMMGALMIIFALTPGENAKTVEVRNRAVRNAMYLTVLFIFIGMFWRVLKGDLQSVDTSSFLIFLILNVLCLEFGIKKSKVEELFKRKK